MSGTLRSGERLRVTDGGDVKVEDFIGAGGQGEVYRARRGGTEFALKWYYAESATPEQHAIVGDLIGHGFADERFLWPKALVEDGHGGFGYLMDLRPPRYAGLPDLFRRRVNVKIRELITACVHLVGAYRSLHGQGIAYRDISYGNVFFDPDTGDVLVCDNDNAVIDGDQTGITGTMEFMAPELVRGEAAPDTQTDLHSLAVLLFMMLMNHHPLEGALEHRIRCLDENAKIQLYGTHPVFVFDPADLSNRPVPGYHVTVLATWAAIPRRLQNLFVEAFTDGLRKPTARVRETQWSDALNEARDSVVACAGCGRQNIFDWSKGTACWSCKQPLAKPPVLEITTRSPKVVRRVLLSAGSQVFAHHLDGEPSRYAFREPIADLTAHPTRPGLFGLRNLTQESWTAHLPGGSTQEVPPGRSIGIRDGIELRLVSATAVMRAPRGQKPS